MLIVSNQENPDGGLSHTKTRREKSGNRKSVKRS